jgi:hypothetical protein
MVLEEISNGEFVDDEWSSLECASLNSVSSSLPSSDLILPCSSSELSWYIVPSSSSIARDPTMDQRSMSSSEWRNINSARKNITRSSSADNFDRIEQNMEEQRQV